MLQITDNKWAVEPIHPNFVIYGRKTDLMIAKVLQQKEQKANSRLIAAAPELYDLLFKFTYEKPDYNLYAEAKELLTHINGTDQEN